MSDSTTAARAAQPVSKTVTGVLMVACFVASGWLAHDYLQAGTPAQGTVRPVQPGPPANRVPAHPLIQDTFEGEI